MEPTISRCANSSVPTLCSEMFQIKPYADKPSAFGLTVHSFVSYERVGKWDEERYRKGDRKPNLPTHVIVNDCECLEKDSIILLGQIRTLDKQRLQEYIGTFDRRLMMSVDKALTISIGISKKD